jgi:hypothetical protein
VKRGDLLRHPRQHGCHLKQEGRSHSLLPNYPVDRTGARVARSGRSPVRYAAIINRASTGETLSRSNSLEEGSDGTRS